MPAGSSAGTASSRRCRASFSPAAGTCAEVVRAVTAGAPEVHGIVEEAWPSAAHVADPMLFFNAGGDRDRLNGNITAMLESVTACLDLDSLRNSTMSEYLLTSR